MYLKNNPGGLKRRKIEPKLVEHYENTSNPYQCFVKLYTDYLCHCPPEINWKTDEFYLTPLKKPKGNIWFSNVPVVHNALSKTVCLICVSAGIGGFKMNNLLRVTTATGHRSLNGVRLYKRTGHLNHTQLN